MKTKTYLRYTPKGKGNFRFYGDEKLEIWEGDIEEDREHWKKLGVAFRYFELKEIK